MCVPSRVLCFREPAVYLLGRFGTERCSHAYAVLLSISFQPEEESRGPGSSFGVRQAVSWLALTKLKGRGLFTPLSSLQR